MPQASPDATPDGGGRAAEAALTPCPLADSASPFPSNGKALLNLEGQLRQAEQLAAYGELAAEAVHEISNLTTIVLFNAQLLRESQERQDKVNKYVDPILRASSFVATLCNQLRNLSRPERPRPRAVDLVEVARGTCQLLERIVGRAFTFEYGSDLPLWVFTDPGNISQVLINLVLNARDATDEETGRIAVRVGVVPGEEPEQAWRFIDVQDNGHGMSPEVRQQLFKLFFTTKPSGRGTGLGLVTVQRMVQEMQGRMELATEAGHGTRFRILLPPAEPPDPDAITPSAAQGTVAKTNHEP
ncbi:MAG: HAMP domain-containing sensor histidine kinase [Opitutaceae bacterium]|nr:HAMP domain-containing sensor histidine kinase [Opitutaceae bacterium]